MKKNRRINKGRGVLIRFEDTLDVMCAIRHSMRTEQQTAIEYMKKGNTPFGRLHYHRWKKLNEACNTVYDASCTLGSWRRVGWR